MTSVRAMAAAVTLLSVVGGMSVASAQICPARPGDAFAFLQLDDGPQFECPAVPVVHWVDPNVVYECDFFLDADKQIDCGGSAATCAQLCRDAANAWNTGLAGHFRFIDATAGTPVGFCERDGRTSLGGGTRDCQDGALGANVLAVALRVNFIPSGELVDSDVIVNQAFAFTQDRFQATLGHEFGHVIGLDHPNQCDKDFNVLMRSASAFSSASPCFVLEPTVDDLNGALLIYPEAQTICGDANGSGALTEADGIEVLRSAAGLSSTCSVETCDATGNFVIDDTDAVNVFRAAAGLSATQSCPVL